LLKLPNSTEFPLKRFIVAYANTFYHNHCVELIVVKPRVMPKQTLLRYCEVVAALKVRTTNGQGRHLSTVQAIRLLEEHGINTDTGHISAPPGLLKKTTVNRYLAEWGYDREKLSRQPPAVRFEVAAFMWEASHIKRACRI
jgi:hypothetical protein